MRPFERDDAHALARFFAEREFDIPGGAFPTEHELAAADILDLFERERTLLAVLGFVDGRIVASFEIRHLDPDVLWVCSLYVDPALRGRGVGTRLGFAVIQYLAERSGTTYRHARASYSPANRIAMHVYRSLGVVESRSGHLEILTPALMRIPMFARFAQRHRLFDRCETYRQAFSFDAAGVYRVDSGAGDSGDVERFGWNGQRVYPQRFAIGDDWIEVIFDAHTLSPCRIAVPDWSAELASVSNTSDRVNVVACLRVTNDRRSSLAVTFPGASVPRVLLRSDRLEAEAEWHSLSQSHGDGQVAVLSLQVVDDVFEMGCWVPSTAPTKEEPRHPFEPAAVVKFGAGDTTAEIDPALDGRLQSFTIGNREALLTARAQGERSLGWIYPWKGGLFTLVTQPEDGEAFHRPPWGAWPGWVGFNAEPTGWDRGEDWFVREAVAGCLVERTRFQLTSSSIRVRAHVTNAGGKEVRAAFGLFAFLMDTRYDSNGPTVFVRADDGDERRGSRRSFEVASRAQVTVDAGARRFTLSITEGQAAACAFNLGDDGVHFLAHSMNTLGPKETFSLAVEMRFERRAE